MTRGCVGASAFGGEKLRLTPPNSNYTPKGSCSSTKVYYGVYQMGDV